MTCPRVYERAYRNAYKHREPGRENTVYSGRRSHHNAQAT